MLGGQGSSSSSCCGWPRGLGERRRQLGSPLGRPQQPVLVILPADPFHLPTASGLEASGRGASSGRDIPRSWGMFSRDFCDPLACLRWGVPASTSHVDVLRRNCHSTCSACLLSCHQLRCSVPSACQMVVHSIAELVHCLACIALGKPASRHMCFAATCLSDTQQHVLMLVGEPGGCKCCFTGATAIAMRGHAHKSPSCRRRP